MTLRRFALKLDVPALGRRIVTIRECDEQNFSLSGGCFSGIEYNYTVYPDPTDTWSHSVDRYPASDGEVAEIQKQFVVNEGVCFRDEVKYFTTSGGTVQEIRRNYFHENGIDIKLRINWCCQQQVLKMEFDIPFEISQRYDAVPGAFIKRECNGKEYPVQGAIVLSERNGKSVVIAGNFSACDVQCNGKVRLTLLRTPVYSHHDPLEIPGNHIYNVSDLGVNEFSLKVAILDEPDLKRAAELREAAGNPLFFSEVTLGCKSKYE